MESRITEVYGHEMREQVVDIILDALNRQGFPNMSRESLRSDTAHRAAFLAMLDDCRPLPIILQIKSELRQGHL
jgi:hypothetical protein